MFQAAPGTSARIVLYGSPLVAFVNLACFGQVWYRGREEVRIAEGPYPLSLAIASLHASGASAKALPALAL